MINEKEIGVALEVLRKVNENLDMSPYSKMKLALEAAEQERWIDIDLMPDDLDGEILGYGVCEYEINGTGSAPEVAVINARSYSLVACDYYSVTMSPTHYQLITPPKGKEDDQYRNDWK